jgi:hypothetical protein
VWLLLINRANCFSVTFVSGIPDPSPLLPFFKAVGALEPGVGTGIRGGLPDTGILPMNGICELSARQTARGSVG